MFLVSVSRIDQPKEHQCELLQYVRKHEITDADIITMQVSRSETVAGYHMMRGENPIMIGSF